MRLPAVLGTAVKLELEVLGTLPLHLRAPGTKAAAAMTLARPMFRNTRMAFLEVVEMIRAASKFLKQRSPLSIPS